MALNYTSGDDLVNQTSFTGAAMAAGAYPEDGLADAPPPNVAAGGGGRGATTSSTPVQVQQRVVYDKVGRNDPCPCGEREEVQEVRDPLVEYKGEGFDLFNDMLEGVKTSTVTTLMKNSPEDLAMFTAITMDEPVMSLDYTSGDDLANQTSFTGAAMACRRDTARRAVADAPPPNVVAGGTGRRPPPATAARAGRQQRIVYDKVGRNDPCPCGSGKKYKKCHGASTGVRAFTEVTGFPGAAPASRGLRRSSPALAAGNRRRARGPMGRRLRCRPASGGGRRRGAVRCTPAPARRGCRGSPGWRRSPRRAARRARRWSRRPRRPP